MSDIPKALTGFRFSAPDALILIAGIAAGWCLYHSDVPLWWIAPVVTGHFFLFCNVFRIRRGYELIWAVIFVINVCCWLLKLSTGWVAPLLAQAPVTIGLILAEMFSPRYHGVFPGRLNPHLKDYVKIRQESFQQ